MNTTEDKPTTLHPLDTTYTTPWFRRDLDGVEWVVDEANLGICDEGLQNLFHVPKTCQRIRFVLTPSPIKSFLKESDKAFRVRLIQNTGEWSFLQIQSEKHPGYWYDMDDGGLLYCWFERQPGVEDLPTVSYWYLYAELDS